MAVEEIFVVLEIVVVREFEDGLVGGALAELAEAGVREALQGFP